LWRVNSGGYVANVATDLAPSNIQPWADSLFKQRKENYGKDDPSTFQCLPQGPRFDTFNFNLLKIVQTPTLILILSEDLTYRQIFLDGRALPDNPNPSFMGYSVGHWDGDTLAVESSGFNDRTWLDTGGHPHTEALRITERFRRIDFGHSQLQMTFEDSAGYLKPWTILLNVDLAPDTELLESVCNENEKDHAHLVGTTSDDKRYTVSVPREVLSRYVGAYESREDPTLVIVANVTLVGNELFYDLGGKDPEPMIPLSETLFSINGDRVEFEVDGQGHVARLVFIGFDGPGFARRTEVK
jgi:hypothetical protein